METRAHSRWDGGDDGTDRHVTFLKHTDSRLALQNMRSSRYTTRLRGRICSARLGSTAAALSCFRSWNWKGGANAKTFQGTCAMDETVRARHSDCSGHMLRVMSKFKIPPPPQAPASVPLLTLRPISTPARECLRGGEGRKGEEGGGGVTKKMLASLPWIKLVDDALEANDREKSGAKAGQAGQEENAKRQQGLPACRL